MCIQTFTSPLKSSRTGSQTKHQPPQDMFYPTDIPPHTWAEHRHRANERFPPARRGAVAPAAHASPLFSLAAGRCLRAAPGARRTLRRSAPRKHHGSRPTRESCWRRARAHADGNWSDFSLTLCRQSGRTPSPPAAPSPHRAGGRTPTDMGKAPHGPAPRPVRPAARVTPAHSSTFPSKGARRDPHAPQILPITKSQLSTLPHDTRGGGRDGWRAPLQPPPVRHPVGINLCTPVLQV